MIRSHVQVIYFFVICWSPLQIAILLLVVTLNLGLLRKSTTLVHCWSNWVWRNSFFKMLTVKSEKEELRAQINNSETIRWAILNRIVFYRTCRGFSRLMYILNVKRWLKNAAFSQFSSLSSLFFGRVLSDILNTCCSTDESMEAPERVQSLFFQWNNHKIFSLNLFVDGLNLIQFHLTKLFLVHFYFNRI